MRFDFFPWRTSGVVLGPLLNDPAALAALGDAVDRPPYKQPPRAPVLYVKPRNTLIDDGGAAEPPPEGGELELGASLAMVIGHTACRVDPIDAVGHIAGWTLVADLSVPHDTFYRPSVRFKARDRSCLVGPRVLPRGALADPSVAVLRVSVDGRPVHDAAMGRLSRDASRLLADVSAFMTLHPGDLLMLGITAGAPHIRAGQRFAIECAPIGRLDGAVAAESRSVA